MKEAKGLCFSFAFGLATSAKLILCHGRINGTESVHAWVEDENGNVKDWQTDQGLRPGAPQGGWWTPGQFKERFEPAYLETYTPVEAWKKGLRSGHYGPWDEN